MIQSHRYFSRSISRSIPTYYQLQTGLFLAATSVTFVSALFASSHTVSGLFSEIVFKTSVFFFVMVQFGLLTGTPILWLNMIEVAPKAMFQFRRARLFVSFFLRLVARLRRVKIRPYAAVPAATAVPVRLLFPC
jgi:hypothetical protein